MNNPTNEPQQATSEQSSRWRPSAEELQLILEKHNQWLKYEYNTDLDHLRADLSGADLSRAQLQGAILTGAQLQGAFLPGAQLQEAFLNAAELKGAFLVAAQLRDAYLVGAQLQGAILSQAQLQGATLINAKLEYAYLPGAQLQGAVLNDADFCEASLIGANFERLAINKGGEPGQERSADLTDANFRDADLSNAQLKTVTGLRAEMLAGAVLTNAKLPEDVARFDQLKHVEETSRNASTVFFGLLVASLYSWLTIATTTDVALITGVASSPLPIINTNIALRLLLGRAANPDRRLLLLSPVLTAAVGRPSQPSGQVPGRRSARS
jgi:uncharacterized protein YjbI with pentapeptide repeats